MKEAPVSQRRPARSIVVADRNGVNIKSNPKLTPSPNIYEMVIFDGRSKEFRILNLSTGSIYSGADETAEQAAKCIAHNEPRAGKTVKRVDIRDLRALLDKNQEDDPQGWLCQQTYRTYPIRVFFDQKDGFYNRIQYPTGGWTTPSKSLKTSNEALQDAKGTIDEWIFEIDLEDK